MPKHKIGFRVDANEEIATGHLMRCVAIASELKKQGSECIFFLAEEKMTDVLVRNKFSYHVLNTDWRRMESEIDVLKEQIKCLHLNWLVVDSYQATDTYLSSIEQMVPVLYVDDMASEAYHVSALLHYSQWPGDNSYEKKYQHSQVKLLPGMKYAPLREEFCGVHSLKRERSIMLTTGGTDTYNVAGQILQYCITNQVFQEFEFHVIVGKLNHNIEMLRAFEQTRKNVHLHVNIRNISEYMRTCSYAVSAGGTTLFELCACRIPTVCFSFADNQKEFVKEMGKHHIMLSVGDARERENIAKDIYEALSLYERTPGIKREYIENMSKLVDGNGTKRIAGFLRG